MCIKTFFVKLNTGGQIKLQAQQTITWAQIRLRWLWGSGRNYYRGRELSREREELAATGAVTGALTIAVASRLDKKKRLDFII